MANLTKTENLIDPEVYEDVLRSKIDMRLALIPFATVDDTLEGNPGSTVTISRFVWDGEAVDIQEGEDIPMRALGSETAEYTVKMAALGTSITDMALLNSKGDPVGASAQGLADSLYGKIDEEMYVEFLKAKSVYEPGSAVSYNNIIDAIGMFQAEGQIDMVMLCNPNILTTLRKDENFIDKNKYGNNVMMNGEIGMIANARIVLARRVTGVGGFYYTPIVLLSDPDHRDDIPAITYFLKRDTNVEIFRKSINRTTEITADQVYIVSLTNDSKVVILKTTGAKIAFKKMYEDEYTYPGASVSVKTTPIKGEVSMTYSASTPWAVDLKLYGEALPATSAIKTALSLDASATHYITGCIEIPGQKVSATAPTVTLDGTAVTADHMRKIGACWYVDVVMGLKLDATTNKVVLASGETSLVTVCNGITTTITPDLENITLSA